jgi:CHASE2 domain-containing sensor protein
MKSPMRLVRRSPGVSLFGCILLGVVSFRLTENLHWNAWKGFLLYALLLFAVDYSIELSKRTNQVRRLHFSSLLIIFGLPAYAVVLILQDSLFRWVFLIPVVLGLGVAGLIHRRTGTA